MPLTPSYSLLLLDADGPLIYSLEASWGATNRVLESFNLDPMSLDEWRQKLRSPYDRFYLNAGVPQDRLGEALRLFEKFAVELRHTTRRVEVEETLKRLGRGRLAVVTDMSRNSWERYSEEYGFGEYIGVAVTKDDCDERKPSSKPLFKAAEKMGISKKKIRSHKRHPSIRGLMIGDTVTDVTAGRNAGFDTAAIFYEGSYNTRERLEASEPTYLIPRLDVVTDPFELRSYQINPNIIERRRRR